MPTYETKTRGKIKVPLTNKQRVQSWREKNSKEGGRNLSVWLDADTVKQMDFLLDKFPDKNKASLVAHAIESFYQKNISQNR